MPQGYYKLSLGYCKHFSLKAKNDFQNFFNNLTAYMKVQKHKHMKNWGNKTAPESTNPRGINLIPVELS